MRMALKIHIVKDKTDEVKFPLTKKAFRRSSKTNVDVRVETAAMILRTGSLKAGRVPCRVK